MPTMGLKDRIKNIAAAVRSRLPRRSRRQWVYVSPQRRGIGVAVLALIVIMVYGYWHFTNERRIRREAIDYLKQATGYKIYIRHASFNPFTGVELGEVSLYPSDRSIVEPFFQAQKVTLKHKPLSLLAGKLEIAEIVCDRPVVTFEYQTGGAVDTNVLGASTQTNSSFKGPLPNISLVGGKLNLVDRQSGFRRELPLSVYIVQKDPSTCLVTFWEQMSGQESTGTLEYNFQTGKYALVTGLTPLAGFDQALPDAYSKWRKKYDIRGDVRLISQSAASQSSDPDIELDMVDVALTLPKAEGGVELSGVNGRVRLSKKGVQVDGIYGTIAQLGGAKFEISGRYDGFEDNSPFNAMLKISSAVLPQGQLEGPLTQLAELRDLYRASGKINVSAIASRKAGQDVNVEGTVVLNGVSARYKYFPYPMDEIKGSIGFKGRKISVDGITGKRCGMKVRIDGTYEMLDDGEIYDVKVSVDDVQFDNVLMDAVKPKFRAMLERLNAGGSSDAVMRVYRKAPKDEESIDLALNLDGKGKIKFVGFPYPVEKLSGQILVDNKNVQIKSLAGAREGMKCLINGTISDIDTADPVTQLTVEVTDIPLDQTLCDAMGKGGKEMYVAVNPGGVAGKVLAKVWQGKKSDVEYDVKADLSAAKFRCKAFPYDVQKVAGPVYISPTRVIIGDDTQAVRGSHDNSAITIRGQVVLSQKTGLDLQISADGMKFDKDLYSAISPKVREVWNKVLPAGVADMKLWLRQDMPDQTEPVDYKLELTARQMEVRYEGFPYMFRGVSGKVAATPAKIVLENVSSVDGPMRAAMNGQIRLDTEKTDAILSIVAQNIPMNKELLAALPLDLSVVTEKFSPGGTCDLFLGRLALYSADEVAAISNLPDAQTRPATAPATGPATAPARRSLWWSISDGIVTGASPRKSYVTFKNANIDMGFGPRLVSGSIVGAVSRDKNGLAINSELALDKIAFSQRQITDVTSKIIKLPQEDRINIKDLKAKLYDGTMEAQNAVIVMGDSATQYELLVQIDDVALKELIAGGQAASQPATGQAVQAKSGVDGLIDGRIHLSMISGKPDSLQAEGILSISQANFTGKVPVMLGLLNVITLSIPGESPFTSGEVAYKMSGDDLVLSEVFLTGKALSIIGSGKIDMKAETLKLDFLTGPPGKVPRMDLLQQLLRGITREIVQIEISGSLKDPKTRTVMFRNIEDVIETLTHPSP